MKNKITEELTDDEKAVVQVSLELFKAWMKIMNESKVNSQEQTKMMLKIPITIKNKLNINKTEVDNLSIEQAVRKMYSDVFKK